MKIILIVVIITIVILTGIIMDCNSHPGSLILLEFSFKLKNITPNHCGCKQSKGKISLPVAGNTLRSDDDNESALKRQSKEAGRLRHDDLQKGCQSCSLRLPPLCKQTGEFTSFMDRRQKISRWEMKDFIAYTHGQPEHQHSSISSLCPQTQQG